MRTMNEIIAWFDAQSEVDRRTIALNAIETVMNAEEVRFSEERDCLYFVSCGEDLRVPF